MFKKTSAIGACNEVKHQWSANVCACSLAFVYGVADRMQGSLHCESVGLGAL